MEFLDVMASKMGENSFEDDLRDAFLIFDRDSNGYISKRELTFVMTSLGEHITDTAIENMIKEVDLDGDGRVNYEGNSKLASIVVWSDTAHKEPQKNMATEHTVWNYLLSVMYMLPHTSWEINTRLILCM